MAKDGYIDDWEDENDYKELWKIAYRYARANGTYDHQIAEDFAQEFCLAKWLGHYGSIKILYVNFLRDYYGRNDKYASQRTKLKSEALRTMISYDEKKHRK